MPGTGWCIVQITDIGRYLAFPADEPARDHDHLIRRAAVWVQNRRRMHPDYPLSDTQWIEQAICSDLIKAVLWERRDLLPVLGGALIKLTEFEVVLVQGSSDGVPASVTELLINGEELRKDWLPYFVSASLKETGRLSDPDTLRISKPHLE